MVSVERLHYDVLGLIFSRLQINDLFAVALVCRSFHHHSLDPLLDSVIVLGPTCSVTGLLIGICYDVCAQMETIEYEVGNTLIFWCDPRSILSTCATHCCLVRP